MNDYIVSFLYIKFVMTVNGRPYTENFACTRSRGHVCTEICALYILFLF